MIARSIVLAAGCAALVFGCAEPPQETQEIVGNLVKAGFPAADIMVVEGKVYVGRDAEVSLAASREMLQAGDTPEEQYRTTNLVSSSLAKICINGSTFTGAFSTALDLAIQNYDELPLTFAMGRAPSADCGFTINAVIDPNMNGGVAGFPSNGNPYGQITIGGQLSQYGVDVIEHVITHEIGHTLGFRHSDYYNRGISCGSGGNEGDAGVGAIHIPGTPTTAAVGASIMNSCFRSVETGEFTSGDITALKELYSPPRPDGYLVGDWENDGRSNLATRFGPCVFMDTNFDGVADRTQCFGNGGSEDQYLVGDWDGDGRSNLAVRRGSCVLMDTTFDGVPEATQCFGNGGGEDQYLVGDWDGDGRSNLAVRRGRCVLMDTNFDGVPEATQCYGDGASEDQYLVGDWDGDGRSNLAVRRGSCVLMDTNFDGAADITQCFGNGASEDQYLVGDWDGDGRSNLAVRRGGCVLMDTTFDGIPERTQCYVR
ncbi:zinc-dependent metalloprotease [Myxococcus sp. AM011]|uniref:zinc-dependent metalloprotease n=1 Tax=Myxococcus sp. AM011 TaxID=2745200 RepID=UPI0026E55F8C|nr:zinc-dependent metalloprotease [Myxococcus sp. AM011]